MTVLNKIDQTTNEFTIRNADSTNIPTKFIENSVTNLLNTTVLNKVDQTTNEFTISNANSTNIPTQCYEFTKCDRVEKN